MTFLLPVCGQEKAKWLKEDLSGKQSREEGRGYLEDYCAPESIEIDELLYLALKHRAMPVRRREEESVVHSRKRQKHRIGDVKV